MTAYVWVVGTCCVVTCAANTFSQPTISLLVGQTDVMTSQEVRSKIRENILLSHMPDAALTILFIRAACVCDARSGVCVCARMHSVCSHSPDGLKQLFYQQTWPDASLRETNRLMVAAGGWTLAINVTLTHTKTVLNPFMSSMEHILAWNSWKGRLRGQTLNESTAGCNRWISFCFRSIQLSSLISRRWAARGLWRWNRVTMHTAA